MKRNFYIAICFLFVLCLSGCNSSKQSGKGNASNANSKNDASSQTLIAQEIEPDIDIEYINRAVAQEEATLIESPFPKVKEEPKKNYTGWIGMGDTKATVENQIGAVKVRAMGKYGTFNIYAVDKSKKSTPVFSTADEFTSTSFYLLAGKKIYKLSGNNGIDAGAELSENGVHLRYIVPNIADVLIDFSVFKSDSEHDADMVKVTSTVKSLAKRTDTFALRIVLDTVLGEKGKFPFYNSDNLPIRSEVMYRTTQKTKWIVSKNDNTTLQILLQGADITPIDFVAVANYETLDILSWEPNMLSERNFNTVRSYNNSAVGINWFSKELATDESFSCVFYLALATDSEQPNGEVFLENNTKIGEIDSEKSNEPESAANKDESSKNAKKLPAYVDFDVDTISSDRISQEYIQRILDRISDLEEGDPNVNSEELMILNKELDLILEKLRNR